MLIPLGLLRERLLHVPERVVESACERLGAAEVVDQRRVVRVQLETGRDLGGGGFVVSALTVLLSRERPFPRRRLVGCVARAADRKDRGVRLLRTRVALHSRVADEDRGPGRRVEALPVERERRAPCEDEIDLLVAVGPLRVLLDDIVARVGRDVRVDPERADVERPPHRPPEQRAADDRDRLDLVELDALPPLGHALDSTRGRAEGRAWRPSEESRVALPWVPYIGLLSRLERPSRSTSDSEALAAEQALKESEEGPKTAPGVAGCRA